MFLKDILERIEILLTFRDVANWESEAQMVFYSNNYLADFFQVIRKHWLHLFALKEDPVNGEKGYEDWQEYLKVTVKIVSQYIKVI